MSKIATYELHYSHRFFTVEETTMHIIV